MEGVGFLATGIAVAVLIETRKASMLKTPGGEVLHKFLIAILAATTEHIFMFFSPRIARDRLKTQMVIFKDKHTYIMTWLYIMCFGSFIGYSGSFPKLIVDLFGYLTGAGCVDTESAFTLGGDQATCEAAGGTWDESYDYPNPNAPSSAKIAWLGAAVGSFIRPIGGIMADKYGGAKMSMCAIVWITIAAFAQGALVKTCRKMDDPMQYYGLFIFLFLSLFLGTGKEFAHVMWQQHPKQCAHLTLFPSKPTTSYYHTGFMNGTTCATIGVLMPPSEAGPVLGWSSAIAAYGSFIIPVMFGIALKAGAPEVTFFGMGGYYITCGIMNFWYYIRPGCERPGV